VSRSDAINRCEAGSPDPVILHRMGEFFAAGYFEEPQASPVRRWGRAVRRRFENHELVPYAGELLFPCGLPRNANENQILTPDFSFTWAYNDTLVEEQMARASDEAHETLTALRHAMREECNRRHKWRTSHVVGGKGYTHSIPNYGRVVHEGLDEHARRVEEGLAAACAARDTGQINFYLGLQDVCAGIRAFHKRVLDAIETWASKNGDTPVSIGLRQVPFEPARTFHEAMLAYNFTFYLDDCDNPGRIDQELYPFLQRDLEARRITRDEALAVIAQFADNVCSVDGWSAAIGGTDTDGAPAYNELTVLCLEAAHGRHRPNYQLRVRDDMPDAIWDAALDALASGSGQPAFYNERLFMKGLRDRDLGVSESDLAWWNGGGCTETMVHGRSNVGSLEAGIHLPLVLESMMEKHLGGCKTFEELIGQFKAEIDDAVAEIVNDANLDQECKARVCPQPMRSLLVDDCIDRGVDFNAGGARYNWSVINVAGLANVADSLAAVRTVVFETSEIRPEALSEILRRNFEDDEPFRQRLARCPRFGNDDPAVDSLAADIAEHVFLAFRRHTPWRGGRFLPSCIMFEVYGPEGGRLGATPDGRLAGQPLADSIGPYQGRDTHGPTAMLRSVTRLPLEMALGTPVVNIRFGKELFIGEENRQRVRELLQAYFRMGGMQIQVSVVDQDVLRDAMAHPERHADLIVRIGGYSAYFNSLSPELKQAVLERSLHSV
jgi:pyruvate-formate lyase